jgi:hypothetical protein
MEKEPTSEVRAKIKQILLFLTAVRILLEEGTRLLTMVEICVFLNSGFRRGENISLHTAYLLLD